MKKIVFVTQYFDVIGGVVRVISRWSNYFVKKGYEVEVVSVRKGRPYFEVDKRVKLTTENFIFENKLLHLPHNTLLMREFLEERKDCNVIFNKSLYIEPVWFLRKLGLFSDVNLIYFNHGGSSDFKNFYLSRKLTAHRVKMSFEAFDKVVCLYDDEKEYPPQVKKEKLYFIPNPLPFEPSDIKLEEKDNIVLYLGRVTKEKGVDTLIYSWSKIKDEVREWKLQIVGDGEDKKEFIELAKSLDIKNIEFIDATSQVKFFYERAKIFVIPSLAEGMPMTILEAMACKCCVISSKTAGGKKLLENGKNGVLFEIGNVDELAQKIVDLIKDETKRRSFIDTSFEYVEQYKIENIAKKWDNVLK